MNSQHCIFWHGLQAVTISWGSAFGTIASTWLCCGILPPPPRCAWRGVGSVVIRPFVYRPVVVYWSFTVFVLSSLTHSPFPCRIPYRVVTGPGPPGAHKTWKFWNWGPTTIWQNKQSVTFNFSKSLHPTAQQYSGSRYLHITNRHMGAIAFGRSKA